MTMDTPHKTTSLVERASQAFDFDQAIAANIPDVPQAAMPPALMSQIASTTIIPFPKSPEPRLVGPFRGRDGQVDLARLQRAGYIVPGAATGSLGEELRMVKRHLLSAQPDKKGAVILVCSANPGEGKTFCAINIALSLTSERDREVLLIDGDFSKPEIINILGLESGPGFMDALNDPALDIERCVIRTDIAGLSVLPAGQSTHHDTEHLSSVYGKALLDNLITYNAKRIIVMDSSPILAASQGSALARHMGQIVMVVRADVTGENELRDALAMLDGCSTVQLLLNAVTLTPKGGRFGSPYGCDE